MKDTQPQPGDTVTLVTGEEVVFIRKLFVFQCLVERVTGQRLVITQKELEGPTL